MRDRRTPKRFTFDEDEDDAPPAAPPAVAADAPIKRRRIATLVPLSPGMRYEDLPHEKRPYRGWDTSAGRPIKRPLLPWISGPKCLTDEVMEAVVHAHRYGIRLSELHARSQRDVNGKLYTLPGMHGATCHGQPWVNPASMVDGVVATPESVNLDATVLMLSRVGRHLTQLSRDNSSLAGPMKQHWSGAVTALMTRYPFLDSVPKAEGVLFLLQPLRVGGSPTGIKFPNDSPCMEVDMDRLPRLREAAATSSSSGTARRAGVDAQTGGGSGGGGAGGDVEAPVPATVAASRSIDTNKSLGIYHHKRAYPTLYLGATQGKPLKMNAHRFVLFAVRGLPLVDEALSQPDLDAMMSHIHAVHICENPRCVNYLHLFWGTAGDNNLRTKAIYDEIQDVDSTSFNHIFNVTNAATNVNQSYIV